MIPVFCPLCCDQPFESQDALFHHLRSLRNNLFCPICSEKFCSFDLLIGHLSRKCSGPVSPHEAKRRCLLSQTKPSVTLGDSTIVSPGNNDSEKIKDVLVENSCGKALATPADIKLPKGVTLSLGPAEKLPPQKNNHTVKPPVALFEKKNPGKNSPIQSTGINNSLSVVLNKVCLNPNLEISVNESKDDVSILEDNVSTKDTPSVSSRINDNESSSQKKVKAGPLSSKLKRNILKDFHLDDKNDKLSSGSTAGLVEKSDILGKETISMMNGDVNTEKSPLETTTGKRIRQAKINNFEDSNLEVKNKRSARRKRKRVVSIDSSISSDDSDIDDGARKSDTDYEPEEGEMKSWKKKTCLNKKENPSSKGQVGKSTKDKTPDKSKTEFNGNMDTSSKKKENIENSFKKKETKDQNEENALNKMLDKTKAKSNENKKSKETNLEPGIISSAVESSKPEENKEHKNMSPGEKPNIVEGDKDSATKDETKTEEEEEYICSYCDTTFTSIYEHIKEYHNGQEVVVEVPPEEIQEDLKTSLENSQSLVSLGPESTESTVNDDTKKKEKAEQKEPPKSTTADSQPTTKAVEKKKKAVSGFTVEGLSDELVYTKTFKKVKKDTGKWVQLQSGHKKLYQYVTDEDKYQLLTEELRNNKAIHPEFNMSLKKLFESPKINVVEITYRPNSPYLVHKNINFTNPMPMFIVDREATNSEEMLGGIASYIMAAKGAETAASMVGSKVIAVMKVIIASDLELTVENIVFCDKPGNLDMIPVLEDVKQPDIPLLQDAKILKWKCSRCLATTWKFPHHKETHFCNACPICHKTFISPVSLKKHLVLHKRDGTKYCKDCQASFISKAALNSHLAVHDTHISCDKCHLYVSKENIDEHTKLHSKDPSEQFPCSVCKKMYGSSSELKSHETKLCSKLVAKFNCSLCDKKYFTQTALSYHMYAHNNVTIKISCRFCPKIFLQEKEQCPKKAGKRKPSSFIQRIWHERIHTRDRPYLCQSCPKRFRSYEHETAHNSKVHSPSFSTPLRNVHVHMCTYCDKVFRNERQLTAHMMQHTRSAELPE